MSRRRRSKVRRSTHKRQRRPSGNPGEPPPPRSLRQQRHTRRMSRDADRFLMSPEVLGVLAGVTVVAVLFGVLATLLSG